MEIDGWKTAIGPLGTVAFCDATGGAASGDEIEHGTQPLLVHHLPGGGFDHIRLVQSHLGNSGLLCSCNFVFGSKITSEVT